MTWLRYLALTGVLVVVRALGERSGHNWDSYLIVGLIATLLASGFIARSRWYGTLHRLSRGSDQERAEILRDLATTDLAVARHAARETGLEVPSFAPAPSTFSYPKGSPVLITILFWLSVFFAAGCLWPLVSHGAEDPANDWVLFLLGVLFLGAAAIYYSSIKWVNREVTIDNRGVRELRRGKVTRAIEWDRLALVKRARPGGLELRSVDGERLVIHPVLRGYGNFIVMFLAYLRNGPD